MLTRGRLVVASAIIATCGAVAAAPLIVELSSPTGTLDTFHRALTRKDRATATALLSPRATIFESGHAELTRDQYAERRLEADMDFAASTTARVIDSSTESHGDVAWVVTRTEVTGTAGKKAIHSFEAETAILERERGGPWRIVHLHRSAEDAPGRSPEK